VAREKDFQYDFAPAGNTTTTRPFTVRLDCFRVNHDPRHIGGLKSKVSTVDAESALKSTFSIVRQADGACLAHTC